MKKFLCLILLASAPAQADSFTFNHNYLPKGPSWYKTIIEGAKNTFNTTFSPKNVLGLTAVCGVIGSIAAAVSKYKENALEKKSRVLHVIANNVMDTFICELLATLETKTFALDTIQDPTDLYTTNSELIKSIIAHKCTQDIPAYYEKAADRPIALDEQCEHWGEHIRTYYIKTIERELQEKKACNQKYTDYSDLALSNNEITYLEAQRKALDTIDFSEFADDLCDLICDGIEEHLKEVYNTGTANTILVSSLITTPIIALCMGSVADLNSIRKEIQQLSEEKWASLFELREQHRAWEYEPRDPAYEDMQECLGILEFLGSLH